MQSPRFENLISHIFYLVLQSHLHSFIILPNLQDLAPYTDTDIVARILIQQFRFMHSQYTADLRSEVIIYQPTQKTKHAEKMQLYRV
jgi:hypothetical protein